MTRCRRLKKNNKNKKDLPTLSEPNEAALHEDQNPPKKQEVRKAASRPHRVPKIIFKGFLSFRKKKKKRQCHHQSSGDSSAFTGKSGAGARKLERAVNLSSGPFSAGYVWILQRQSIGTVMRNQEPETRNRVFHLPQPSCFFLFFL